MTPTNNLPATVAPSTALQAAPFFDVSNLNVWTSLDPTTPAGKAAIVNYMQGTDAIPATNKIGEVISVRDVLVHGVEILDETTGELVPHDRIVLISPDGTSVACVSEGIKRSLQVIGNLYGLPTWDPPLPLKVSQKQTRKGRRTFNLTPVVEVEAEPTPRGASNRR